MFGKTIKKPALKNIQCRRQKSETVMKGEIYSVSEARSEFQGLKYGLDVLPLLC